MKVEREGADVKFLTLTNIHEERSICLIDASRQGFYRDLRHHYLNVPRRVNLGGLRSVKEGETKKLAEQWERTNSARLYLMCVCVLSNSAFCGRSAYFSSFLSLYR